jgi:hypothetical protein
MNGFSLMTDQKNIFNQSFEPLLSTSNNIENNDRTDVDNLVESFLKSLNNNIKNNVGNISCQTLNTWDDNMPQITPNDKIIKQKSSWEQYNEELGLPSSIFPESAKKSKVDLIKIDHIDKYETSKELKYSVYLILQKKHVSDQMIVKVSFVLNKNDVNLEREFFNTTKNNFETKIIIEEIVIIGFMIMKGFGIPKSNREKFYDYDGFTDGKIISEKDVIKQLNDKKIEISKNFISN